MPLQEIRIYKTSKAVEPFTEWLHNIKYPVIRSRIRRRIDRLSQGNEGDFKCVSKGVFELRLSFGSGYRIYYGKHGSQCVILLCGGNKSSQKRDIKLAQQYWYQFNKDSHYE